MYVWHAWMNGWMYVCVWLYVRVRLWSGDMSCFHIHNNQEFDETRIGLRIADKSWFRMTFFLHRLRSLVLYESETRSQAWFHVFQMIVGDNTTALKPTSNPVRKQTSSCNQKVAIVGKFVIGLVTKLELLLDHNLHRFGRPWTKCSRVDWNLFMHSEPCLGTIVLSRFFIRCLQLNPVVTLIHHKHVRNRSKYISRYLYRVSFQRGHQHYHF
jgi:hypothetical protein